MEKGECQIVDLYRFLGDKWSVEIIHNIDEEPFSFNDLQALTKKKISPSLLSKRIKDLQHFKIIKQEKIDGKINYKLTKVGKEIKEIMHMLKKKCIESGYHIPRQCSENDCYCKHIFD